MADDQGIAKGEPPASLAPFRGVIRAVAATIVPEATALDEPAWTELERLISLAIGDRPAGIQRQIRLFLHVIQWWPVLRFGRSFTALRPEQRTRFLSSLEQHPIAKLRFGFWGIRSLVLLGYYGQPEIARAIGYAADPRGWEAPR